MKWLRERPERWDDLDLVDGKGRWKDGVGNSGLVDEDDEMQIPRKGALFDDEDDVEEEEQDEEEEDGPVQQQQVAVPLPKPTPTSTAHPPTPGKGVGSSPRTVRR